MYNVFTDFHHAGLLNSLIMLFEGRLGGVVYRPIGTEWFERGFWKVYDHPATVEQFLGIGGNTPDGSERLNEVESVSKTPDPIYFCHDIDSGTTNKAITFSGFLNRRIDIVIASMPAHIEPFAKLCELHPNKPKLIYQVGNAWNHSSESPARNIMASARMGGVSIGLNTIEYHQEFDVNIFSPSVDIALPDVNIYSFVNCFDVSRIFKDDWDLFLKLESSLPNWNFKAYGGQCRDGAIGPANKLADKMRESRFIWHTKAGGDGYGHVIHNAPAVGRPLIVKKQYYQGKMAEPLLIDGKTCIAIDGLGVPEIVNKIEYYSDAERYQALYNNTYTNFKKVVNFDDEETKIKDFLNRLQ